ncbi:MAG: hypothetical protein ACLUJG_07295 [Lawsonibacter sp.]
MCFAGTGVNILTINQNIPVNGCAVVTITAETSALQRSLEDMLNAAARQSRACCDARSWPGNMAVLDYRKR